MTGSRSDADPALVVAGLSHAFARTPVLDDVSLTVHEGELVSVLGRSGAGKTTLLRAIGGFLTPTAGRIRLGGVDVTDGGRLLVPTERRQLGIVFQDYALFAHMSVAQNVGFGLPRSERASRVPEMLELVGLGELARRRPAELSGGQQQRVALARALAPRPRLLLLDEPFANLDATLRADLRDGLSTLLRQTGTAALLITHDRTEALSIADRAAVLEAREGAGAVLAQLDAPEAVYWTPASRGVAQLTGAANFLTGTASGSEAVSEIGTIGLRTEQRGPVVILARPEQLQFATGPGEHTVLARQFCGPMVVLSVRAGEGVYRLEVPSRGAPRPGDRGRIVVAEPLHAWPGVSPG